MRTDITMLQKYEGKKEIHYKLYFSYFIFLQKLLQNYHLIIT